VLKIAIPKLNNIVAPCLECANYFLILTHLDQKADSSQIIKTNNCEGYGRVRFLIDIKITHLVCNGIKAFYRDLLKTSGIVVIDNVSDTIANIISKISSGQFSWQERKTDTSSLYCKIPHKDLVCWTKELFTNHGYSVQKCPGCSPFPIDLIAKINCPVCSKELHVAICCGAHTYRSDLEIREFYHCASKDYQAKIYVQLVNEEIRACCREYDIELLDPDDEQIDINKNNSGRIPILRNPVLGHEAARMTTGSL
jgi:predicted Fe-Mo cluster-binding NifX family protein